MHVTLSQVPERIVTGGYILHAGLEKWSASAEHAAAVHAMAAGAFPQFKSMEPEQFVKLLAAGEIATGAALLAPFVSSRLAGAALTGFAGALVGMYWRTPALRKEGSIWPTTAGIGVSKDVWMLGIGLALLAGGGKKRS
jgi:hypothetical protein